MRQMYQAKGNTFAEQYRDLGALFGESIRASVVSLTRKRAYIYQRRKIVAERTLANLRKHRAAEEFVACIGAWAEGACITIEQAMWLMADNLSGCQTVMIRYGSGVALLHSEEDYNDMSSHMTGEQVVSLRDRNERYSCIVYNDLLPGAGLYGWHRNALVGVDTLFLNEEGIENVTTPLLANVVAWIVWRMKSSEATPEKVIAIVETMGELIDGYAINVVAKDSRGSIDGYKITLARSEYRVEKLGQSVGSYMRQVNIVDPAYPKMRYALKPKRMWRGGYKHFLQRLSNIDADVRNYALLAEVKLDSEEVAQVHTKVQKTIYTELAKSYINSNVGAVCVGLIDHSGTSVSCKLNDQQPFDKVEYLDLV